MISQAISDLVSFHFSLLISLCLLTVIFLVFLTLKLKSHGSSSKDSADNSGDSFPGNQRHSNLRVRTAHQRQTSSKPIKGARQVIHKKTGLLYELFPVPDNFLEAYQLYHATNGRLKVDGGIGDVLPPVMYYEQDQKSNYVHPYEILLYCQESDSFTVVKNWQMHCDEYVLQV